MDILGVGTGEPFSAYHTVLIDRKKKKKDICRRIYLRPQCLSLLPVSGSDFLSFGFQAISFYQHQADISSALQY